MIRLFSLACLVVILSLTGWGASLARASGGAYVVQPGDTLAGISARYGLSSHQLAEANGLQEDAALYPGQQLVLPDLAPPFAVVVTGHFYTVKVGDTLGNIAFQYGTTPAALQAANGLVNSNIIHPDQQLFIPGIKQPARQELPGRPAAQPAEPVELPVYTESPPVTPVQEPVAYNAAAEKWIEVNLSSQTLTAYQGQTPVFQALVSSGLPQYPTVVGTFSIYVKYTSARMRGGYGADAYDLPNVPYVMYFHSGYGLHGTYWHNNFGAPMSHGCVNLATPDAEWLFNWAEVGTSVVTHY